MESIDVITVPTTGATYLGYTQDLTDKQVVDFYLARYETLPAQLIRYKNIVWAGPIPLVSK